MIEQLQEVFYYSNPTAMKLFSKLNWVFGFTLINVFVDRLPRLWLIERLEVTNVKN
jgi:hypothetical protein|tara:strand:- start:2799 stop:2966 length:168 start_codon:yes stop_codon:yes gene_type:complete